MRSPAGQDVVAEPPVLLRRLRVDDEAEARAAQAELAAEGFDFLFLADEEPWAVHLARLARERRAQDLPPGRVPHTFLAVEADGALVGRVSVRHALTPFLLEVGGHIGYAVRPRWRRRGYATAALRASLRVAAAVGLERVLLTCDDTNAGSVAVIERCGGVLEDVRPRAGGAPKRRYWIDVPRRA